MAKLDEITNLPLKDHRNKNEFSIKDLMQERHYISLEVRLHGRPLPFGIGILINKIKRLLYEDLYPEHMFTDDIEVEVIETAP